MIVCMFCVYMYIHVISIISIVIKIILLTIYGVIVLVNMVVNGNFIYTNTLKFIVIPTFHLF